MQWKATFWVLLVACTVVLLGRVASSIPAWQLNWSVGRRVISTKAGKLRGLIVKPNYAGAPRVDVFLGIPYAEPPRRFMPPKAPVPWNGVKLATKLSPVCPQNFPDISNKSEALKHMPEGRYHYLHRLYPYLRNQSEDCLYLNVYAPHVDITDAPEEPSESDSGHWSKIRDGSIEQPPNSPQSPYWQDPSFPNALPKEKQRQQESSEMSNKNPVIVFFHGESYDWNSGNPYDGTVLSSFGRVVVITFNFRLGIFGFLRTGVNAGAKANFGLWDQIAALEWIQENIKNFGGDPGNVTLLGHGTGAACINLLMTSTVAHQIKGLFQRVVLMSGSALTPWALVPDPISVTMQIANQVSCPVEEQRKEELADCLRTRSVEELLAAASRVMLPSFTTAFGPVVDGVLIQAPPRRSIQNYLDMLSRYDVMQGVVSAESYFMFDDTDIRYNKDELRCLSIYHINSSTICGELILYGMEERRRDKMVDSFIKSNYVMKSEEILAAVMVDYTNWKKMDVDRDSTRDTAMDIFTDSTYVAGQVEMANFHAAENPKSYFYVFAHQSKFGDYSTPNKFVFMQKFGCIHGEELPYLFGVPLEGPVGANHFQSNFTVPESFLSQMFMAFVTNFARTGDPNIPPRSLIDPQASRRLGGKPKTRSRLRSDRVIWPRYSLHSQRYMSLGVNESRPVAVVFLGRSSSLRHHLYPPRARFPPPLPPQLPPPILRHDHEVTPGEDERNLQSRFGSQRGHNRGGRNETVTAWVGGGTVTAWSLVVGAGLCILVLNACIFFGIYHQRDKIKTRARMLQKQCVLRAVNAGQDVESSDARELEMLCEKSQKELRKEAKQREKHKSQPNLSQTKATIHQADEKLTKSTPARLGQPTPTSSQHNITNSAEILIQPSAKQSRHYATVDGRRSSRRTQSERANNHGVGDGEDHEMVQEGSSLAASRYATSPRVQKRRKSQQYDYENVNKEYYDWIKKPDPEDPADIYVSKSTMTLQGAHILGPHSITVQNEENHTDSDLLASKELQKLNKKYNVCYPLHIWQLQAPPCQTQHQGPHLESVQGIPERNQNTLLTLCKWTHTRITRHPSQLLCINIKVQTTVAAAAGAIQELEHLLPKGLQVLPDTTPGSQRHSPSGSEQEESLKNKHPPTFKPPPPPRQFSDLPGPPQQPSILKRPRPEHLESLGTDSSVDSQNSVIFAGSKTYPHPGGTDFKGFSQSSSEEQAE
ncbi:unnamed protein product [Notodromas monacha]|uniref:Carboxylesterase type B domain-containing protein n=1 Tax=Notodromas monacha TaxID=399045 RepID=A0A7R9BQ00_9CRUS|nr:unnamed protein product [Notodromas monacha]CAG0918185.1 unnamed protein product [Notodromas monacha]